MRRSKFLMCVALAGVFAMLPGCEKHDPGCCDTIAADTATSEAANAKYGVTLKQDTLFIYLNETPRCIRFINNTPKDDTTE